MTERNNRSGLAAVIADCVQTDALLGSPQMPTNQRRSDLVRSDGSCGSKRGDDQEQARREVGEIITGIVFDEPLMSTASLPLTPFGLTSLDFESPRATEQLVYGFDRIDPGCV
ncbi:MAG: hypothetical protein AB8G23_07880 [Myxococcota bacterium]